MQKRQYIGEDEMKDFMNIKLGFSRHKCIRCGNTAACRIKIRRKNKTMKMYSCDDCFIEPLLVFLDKEKCRTERKRKERI